jgi:gliding motility-associated protein GldL
MSAGVNPKIDKLVNVVVCMGAAIVIFGAWQKITHQALADFFLTAGLLTEAIIFIVYAFLPPPGGENQELIKAISEMKGGSNGNPALDKMDKMLQEAEITPANLTRLSESFKKLGATVNSIAEVSDVVKSTNDFATKTKEAGASLDAMKSAYQQAASSVGNLNLAAEGTKQFHEQVQSLTKNLGSLNAMYEVELQDSNNHLKAMNHFYGNLAKASESMKGSIDDAKQVQEQINKLAGNLSSLNTVYGNMLGAMQGRS